MKKVLLGLVFALFTLQVQAATLVTITNDSFTGGGVVTEDEAYNAAIVSHDDIVNGSFNDFWTMTLTPASATLNVASSNPLFSDFNARYSTDSGVTWTDFSERETGRFTETLITGVAEMVTFQVNVWGTTGVDASAYDIRVSAVPIPAAVWLFGSALMGVVGISRRKSVALAA